MPNPWRILSRSSEYRVVCDGDFAPAGEDIKQRADTEWAKAVRKNPTLANGTMLAMASVKTTDGVTVISGLKTEYKYYYVSRLGVDIGAVIEPIAVSGVIRADIDGRPSILIARRGKNVNMYKNSLELIPSGGIDGDAIANGGSVDFTAQLVREFTEESGLDASLITRVAPFALIHDTEGKVYDICAAIELAPIDNLKEKLLESNEEYSDFVIVPVDEIKAFVRKRKHEFVPTSLAIARLLASS